MFVVGYSQSGLQAGATLLAPQFINVSGSGFALDNFTPTGTDLSDNIAIKVLDEVGRELISYVWIEWGGDNGDECYWSPDGSGDKATGVTFEPGQAFWVQGSAADQLLQSAGQVNTADFTYQLQAGATIIGNAYPVAVALNDIIPTGDELSDNVAIKILDEVGRELISYVWIEWGGDDGDECYWSPDGSGDKATDITFAPGQGFWIQGSSDAQYITFPGVEL